MGRKDDSKKKTKMHFLFTNAWTSLLKPLGLSHHRLVLALSSSFPSDEEDQTAQELSDEGPVKEKGSFLRASEDRTEIILAPPPGGI